MQPDRDPQCLRRVRAEADHRAAMASLMRPHVLAALDAADVAPDSATGRLALSAAPDAAYLVRGVEYRRNEAIDREIAAVDVVLWAQGETARGVRVVGA